jgi:hypothetical protein
VALSLQNPQRSLETLALPPTSGKDDDIAIAIISYAKTCGHACQFEEKGFAFAQSLSCVFRASGYGEEILSNSALIAPWQPQAGA